MLRMNYDDMRGGLGLVVKIGFLQNTHRETGTIYTHITSFYTHITSLYTHITSFYTHILLNDVLVECITFE